MQAQYEIRTEQGYVEETFEGSITKPELVAFLTAILDDPQWHPGLHTLVDLSAASVDFHFDDMYALVGFLKSTPITATTRCAFVAPQTANFGMLRMYESLSSELHGAVCVFTERDEALRWLSARE